MMLKTHFGCCIHFGTAQQCRSETRRGLHQGTGRAASLPGPEGGRGRNIKIFRRFSQKTRFTDMEEWIGCILVLKSELTVVQSYGKIHSYKIRGRIHRSSQTLHPESGTERHLLLQVLVGCSAGRQYRAAAGKSLRIRSREQTDDHQRIRRQSRLGYSRRPSTV